MFTSRINGNTDIFDASIHTVIFILRLYAIYSKSKAVLYGFTALLLMELGIKIVSNLPSSSHGSRD